MLWVWRINSSLIPKLAIASMLAVSSIASLVCGQSEPQPQAIPAATATPTPSPTPINPQALLQESGEVMADLESFHFLLEHEDNGGTPLANNLILVRAEGNVVKPDKISVDFSASAGGFAVRSSLISIGSSSYMTNPLNGEWGEVSQEISPLAFFNPRSGISSIMQQVEQPTLASKNSRTYTITGTIPAPALISLFGVTEPEETVNIEVVLDIENLRLLRATLDGKITPSEDREGVVRVIRLSDFNEALSIEPPPLE